jgi:biotin carboxyl carrier protein
MNLTIVVDGKPLPLRLERDGKQWWANDRTVSALEVEPGIYSVLLGKRSFEARIERTEQAWAVTIGRRRFVIAVADPRRLSRKGRGLHGEGRQRIASPMPGKVVRVLVAQGDLVAAGQGVVVVEAMKMQNELKAPRAGRVVTISAEESATVAAGEVLIVIE